MNEDELTKLEMWRERHVNKISHLSREDYREGGNRRNRRLRAKQFIQDLKNVNTKQNVKPEPVEVKPIKVKSSLFQRFVKWIKSLFRRISKK